MPRESNPFGIIDQSQKKRPKGMTIGQHLKSIGEQLGRGSSSPYLSEADINVVLEEVGKLTLSAAQWELVRVGFAARRAS